MDILTNGRTRRAAVALLALGLAAAGCGRGGDDRSAAEAATVETSWNPGSLSAVGGVPAAQVRTSIQQRLGGERPSGIDERQWKRVKALYGHYEQGPLWFTSGGLDGDRAGALLRALLDARADGLRLEDYPLNELVRALQAVKSNGRPTPAAIAEADVVLTAAYGALGEDLLTGQVDPRSVSQDWHIDPEGEHVDSALFRALREAPLERSIARMRPADPEYAVLQKALERYRGLAAAGDPPKVPEGDALKPGDHAPAARLSALRRRLAREGVLSDSAAAQAGGVYDPRLAGAVARFQSLHGIVSDSILGAETVASLNVPTAYRAGQIAANLERYRWLPRTLGSRYIVVNVPAFRLEVYDGGKKAMEMKVIVGEEYEDKKTPVFSDSMQYVVFRPYWLVTPTIAEKEIFPKMEADPGYLEAHHMETYEEHGETRVRQKPGKENSLGLIKFIFPNDYNIYLHDTPEDQLFQKDVRAFSHGCIRVEHPVELASFVLGWPAERVKQQMEEGADDHRVSLPRKVPVYITYFTSYGRDGHLYFASDLYQRDDVLIHQMGPGALPSPQVLRVLDSLRRFVES